MERRNHVYKMIRHSEGIHMFSFILKLLLMVCTAIVLGACAPKSVVLLLPDQDGKTGAIEVRNEGGSQLLNKPYQSMTIRSAGAAPDPPKIMQDSEVKKIFGEVLAAMPSAPAHYILYFLTDSTQLTDESTRVFEDVMASVGKIKPAEISVVGHTDRVGTSEKNFRLGFGRATEVKNLLTQRGVDAGIIEIMSHGEDNPLIKTDDDVAEPQNRRVEIIIR